MNRKDIAGWIAILVGAVAISHFASQGINNARNPSGGGQQPSGGGGTDVGADVRQTLGILVEPTLDGEGVAIESVLPGSPGERAGLRSGDLILEVEGKPITDHQPIHDRTESLQPGEVVTLRVKRATGAVETVIIRFEQTKGYEETFARGLIHQGVEQLLLEQRSDGFWPHYQVRLQGSVAVSALVAYALARAGEDLEDYQREELKSLLMKLLDPARRGPDGGLVDPAHLVPHRTYATGLLLMALGEPWVEAAWPELVATGPFAEWLERAQVQEARGFDPIDARFGGWSYYDRYQVRMRTDVSTARFALQGLAAAGVSSDAPAWHRASLFLGELQNLSMVTAPGDSLYGAESSLRQGGFSFFPRSGKAGSTPLGDAMLVGTAYGSATADGLIALLASAGIDRRSGEASRFEAPPGDPRVLAALRWLARNYTLDRNPGFGEDPRGWGKGLQNYYVAALAEGLHRAGVKTVITSDSIKHGWASELVRAIGEAHGLRGRQFGSDSGLMHEDEPTISAAFSVIALAAARDRLAQNAGSTIEAGAVPPRPSRDIEEPSPIPADARGRGLAIFKAQSCSSCHQDGQATNAPSLVGVGDLYLAELRTDKQARARLQAFLRAPDPRSSLRGGEWPVQMDALSPDQVSDDALSDLIAFLLSCSGDRPVSGLR